MDEQMGGFITCMLCGLIVGATGVVNVQSLTLNGGTADITLTETGTVQQIPVKGTVSLSEQS